MGVPSNKDYLSCVLADPRFADGETTTSFLKDLDFSPHGIEVVEPGMNTTVQVRSQLSDCAASPRPPPPAPRPAHPSPPGLLSACFLLSAGFCLPACLSLLLVFSIWI